MPHDISDFDPTVHIPELTGKVIFVTGGTAGLGKSTITTLAKHNPAHIFFSGRSSSRASEVISTIQSNFTAPSSCPPITFIKCDLTSLASVKSAAEEFLSLSSRLDILINNAGIMAVPLGLTSDGYEIQFGTNHMGHAMLTSKLLPTLLKTAEEPNSDVRIVSLTSLGFRGHPPGGITYDRVRTTQSYAMMGGWFRYGQSKLANILYSNELARRYPSITSVVVHPGVIGTDLVKTLSTARRWFVWISQFGRYLTEEQGAYNSLWAATGPKSEVKSGGFYIPIGKPGPHDGVSSSEEKGKELWEWTEKELAKY